MPGEDAFNVFWQIVPVRPRPVVASLAITVGIVIGRSPNPEVIGMYAWRIIACVANKDACWKFAVSQRIGDSVGPGSTSLVTDYSIVASVAASDPNNTVTLWPHIGNEPSTSGGVNVFGKNPQRRTLSHRCLPPKQEAPSAVRLGCRGHGASAFASGTAERASVISVRSKRNARQ